MSTVAAIGENKSDLRKRAYSIEESHADYVAEPISYGDFFCRYLLPNKICHLGSWVTKGWKSREKWVTQEGKPDISYLKNTFGSAVKCPVANCNQKEYDAHCKSESSFEEYMNYFQDYSVQGRPRDKACLYLKDWHFTKVFPEYGAYKTPEFFESDWLNEFLDEQGWEENKEWDDYRFVYIGPKGSWTPFHSDVLRSHSWSANICGTKLWIIFPPGEEDKLRDKWGNLPFDINSDDVKDGSKCPHALKGTKRLEIVQREGEVVFVPSGWHHQVLNLDDTISINHNWINGTNIDLTWQFLCVSLCDVQREISDCKAMEGWHQQCQLILKASCGVDYAGFYNFIAFIALKRLEFLKKFESEDSENIQDRNSSILSSSARVDKNPGSHNDVTTTENVSVTRSTAEKSTVSRGRTSACFSHVLFDVQQINSVLGDMLVNEEFVLLMKLTTFEKSVINPSVLFDMLSSTIKIA